MKKILFAMKRYRVFLLAFLAVCAIGAVNPVVGAATFRTAGSQVIQMLMVVPPIFILLGLLDVWVPRETMVKYMGEGSGIRGVVLAFLIGSFAAGPLYGAFPIAAVLMRKGVKFTNLMIFIGAWSTTKVPMLLFEMRYMGLRFTLVRLVVNVIGIVLIANLLARLVGQAEVERVYRQAEKL
ncbi:hypothetical protein SDC9_75726 [bioreactor metagenome]|uniref:Permease n=1 Tax=bioreactor metagenome TaxID=1076179 RepID=A0A644YL10_9ZZZZ